MLKTGSASPLIPAFWPPSGGGVGGAFPESEEVLGETFENTGIGGEIQRAGNTLSRQDDAHRVSSIQEINLQVGNLLELRARIKQRALITDQKHQAFTPDAIFFPIWIELDFI